MSEKRRIWPCSVLCGHFPCIPLFAYGAKVFKTLPTPFLNTINNKTTIFVHGVEILTQSLSLRNIWGNFSTNFEPVHKMEKKLCKT